MALSEKDLPENQRANWLKAMSAMELRNYGYAIQLLLSVLKNHPEFLLARQLVRKAAVAKNAGKKSILSGFSSASFSTMKVQSLIKKNPLAAMDAAEKILEGDPYNSSVNQLLKDAALAAKLPEVALFALETIIQGNPKDTKTMHELAKLHMSNDQPQKAVDVYNKILAVNPNDLAAIKGGKDASAGASMQRGGWEQEDATYRDLMKDQAEAVNLEQQGRVVRSDDVIDNLLANLSAKYEKDPQNVDTVRRIGELYEQKNDIENAITWYSYAAGLNTTDSALVRKVSDLRIKQYDDSIASFQAYIADNPGTDEAKQCEIDLENIQKERATLLLDEARKRVDRNPTDLQVRFELGSILVDAGNYKDAIAELQKARSNPNVRLRTMNLLGKCYTERGMYDLAASTLSTAAGELLQMDNVKKDIVYNLGLVYEKMDEKEKSIDCMKQIYEVDYGYRDVAERVEGSYGESA